MGARGTNVRLTAADREMLDGRHGEAARFAMSVVVRMAEVQDAAELLSIEQAHIDACALMSPSSLELVERLVDGGGRVRVPTTLSMVSLDLENWRRLGVPAAFADTALRIANAYRALGCIPAWTCAPYQGYLTPRFGQQIAWGESNAVAYANSALGARTNRYGDYLDICAAITGRVPNVGLHRTENRRGEIVFRLVEETTDAWRAPEAWAALGHLLGEASGDRVPVIEGLPPIATIEQLKALGAAAASAGSVALFHVVGLTPEAPTLAAALHGRPPVDRIDVTPGMLDRAWEDLSSGEGTSGRRLDAVVLGCPHLSYAEFKTLAAAIAARGGRVHPDTRFLVITDVQSHALARRGGLIEPVERFGATIVFDTCPFHSPIVRRDAEVLMTNSGKCAYYAPGELDVRVAFGTTADCVRSAVEGHVVREASPWA